MKIQKGYLLGEVVYLIAYKGAIVYNRSIGKAITSLLIINLIK